MTSQELRELLERFRRGDLDTADAAAELQTAMQPASAATTDACVDLDRQRRCGYAEVVYAEGKTDEAIVRIFEAQQRHGQTCFATRVSAEQAEVLLREFPDALHNPVARTVRLPPASPQPPAGRVAVITAGTSDLPVAEEALETLRWMNCETELIVDVGVAGPHRLREQLHRFQNADAVVVVAGMEGALPSVVGGYVDTAVIAVPTSVGYGASFGGIAALLGMLNSCASNVTVVNIDAGFKGGYVAGLIARKIRRAEER